MKINNHMVYKDVSLHVQVTEVKHKLCRQPPVLNPTTSHYTYVGLLLISHLLKDFIIAV